MLCENCGINEANVKYSENINGVKKEMNLCSECSKKLGISTFNFNMPIDFSSFFGEFLGNFENAEYMPLFNEIKELKCDKCGYTFDDIVNKGKFGCSNCYNVFEDRIDPIIKKIQGNNRHVGRIGKISNDNSKEFIQEKQNEPKENKESISEIERLKEELKKCIKEENYEEAAKLRDKIKKLEK